MSRRAWWWVAVVVGLLVLFALIGRNWSGINIKNSAPDFQVLSVKVTRAGHHVYYFPSRLDYYISTAEQWTHRIKPRLGERISCPADSPAQFFLWIEFKSKASVFPGFREVNPENHKPYYHLSVPPPDDPDRLGPVVSGFFEVFSRWDAGSERGILVWSLISKAPADLSGGHLELSTPSGKSTIQFR